ncbi:MAG: DUF3604 domain-containing protein, partial [Kiritimatiellae bacterium]|nr:DUF3604 domain-containing protein [Kiritimatiellia bacterium]
FRFAGDFGTPQFDDPSKANFCSVSTEADCRIEPRWDPKGNTRPWGKALYLKIRGGFLDVGDKLEVVFGDTSQGSPGWRIQTFCEDTFEFKTLVDPFATYQFKELPDSPTIKIVSGKAVKAVCVAPSQVQKNIAFTAYLRLEDRWGNAVDKAIACAQSGLKECGIHTVECVDQDTGLKAVSNPINVWNEVSTISHWWAEFHGQSEETIGTNSVDEYFSYARDYSMVDIAAHQGNDFQVTDEFWDKINQTTKGYNEPGRFVCFPGYEWSGNTPLGGDRNVYHKEEGGPIYRSSHDLLPDEYSKYPVAPTANDLFKRLKAPESFAFAHVGGRYADVAMHTDDIEVAMEIHSAWGTFEWLVDDAFKHGYRIGICANSDGHKCRPGASYPGANKFGSYGGLTCVLAETLDRDSIFTAMKDRHFYATTGNRLLMNLEIITEDGRKAIMGDVIEAQAATLNVEISGTAPIDYVEIHNGSEVIKIMRPYNKADLGNEIKIIWSGAEVKGRDRISSWDGVLKTHGNKIKSFRPVNFWNPDSQPNQAEPDEIYWESITTGGIAGLIVELENSTTGNLQVRTNQIDCDVELTSVGLESLVYSAGGLMKQLEIYRLPRKSDCKFDFSFALEELRDMDNPIYIKVMQQDGHIAWSSPVYVVKERS